MGNSRKVPVVALKVGAERDDEYPPTGLRHTIISGVNQLEFDGVPLGWITWRMPERLL